MKNSRKTYKYKGMEEFGMTRLFNNCKRLLSITLILAILVLSTFTGATITANASTITVSDTWDGTLASAFAGGTGNADDPYIIETAEQLAYLAKGADSATADRYYKVKDGIIAFDMCGFEGITLDSTLADVKSAKKTGKNWSVAHQSTSANAFCGNFDGNGLIVFNLYGTSTSMGLFPAVRGSSTFGIKNVTVKNSYFSASGNTYNYGAGGIFGRHTNNNTNYGIPISECAVVNCYIANTNTAADSYAAAIGGTARWAAATISNCIVLNNEIVGGSVSSGGLIAVAQNTSAITATNCLVVSTLPYPTGTLSATSSNFTDLVAPSSYSNIYTDQVVGSDFTGITTLTTEQMTGKAATDNMQLFDWQSVWFAAEGTYPTLCRVYHGFEYETIGTIGSCQSEVCTSCKTVSATGISHNYTITGEGSAQISTCGSCGFVCYHTDEDHYTYTESGSTYTKACDCGVTIMGTVDIKCAERKTIYWDGAVAVPTSTAAGTSSDPIIINTAAELAYIVSDNASYTLQSDGSPKHFKIADDIAKIVLQDKEYAEDIIALESAKKVQEYFEDTSKTFYRWPELGYEKSAFCGCFDGNGVTVYGLYQTSSSNAGLFSTIEAGASIHNIALKNSYLTSSSTSHQVGGIFAVTNTEANGGLKTSGMVWVDGCVVANCYMRNTATGTTRSGVLLGNVNEAVTVDNCILYGNDAKYGDSVKMSMIGGCLSTVSLTGIKPEEIETKTSTNYFYNMFRNVICMDTDVMNTKISLSYRTNRPDSFENVLTNGAAGTVEFANSSSITYGESQITAITVVDFATLELGDVWIKTGTYPELKVFHDDTFTTTPSSSDNYAGHAISCSCGVGASAITAHNYIITGEGNEQIATCDACGFVCDHQNANYYEETVKTDGGCVETTVYERVCACGITTTVEKQATGSHTASGNYYINANTHADICKVCDKTFDEAQHTDDNGDNICDICMNTCGDYLFEGASLTITDSLAVNYMIKKQAVDSLIDDLYIKFTFCGKEYIISKYTENGEYYVFTFDKIAPDRMNDIIYATVCGTKDGSAYQSATSEYSIKRYCYNMLEQCSGDENSKLRTLLVDLLNYGAESQKYTNYNTQKFANADLTESQKAWGTPRDVITVSDQNLKYATVETPTVKWRGAGIYLDEEAVLRFTIEADNVNNLVVKATCGTKTIEIPSSKFVKRTDIAQTNRYYVYVRGLNITQMSDTVTLTVYNGETAVSNTITYSVESYAKAKMGGSDEALSNLLAAMMKYSNSAKSYFYANCEHSFSDVVVKTAETFVAGVKEYTCTCGYDYKGTFTVDKIKILSISNSYGQDSFMKMHEMCEAAGFTDIDIAVLYFAGCNLDTHMQKINGTHENDYTLYRYTDETGKWNTPTYNAYDTDVTEFLTNNNDWDIITIQQGSSQSGKSTSYGQLDNIINFVEEKCPNSKIIWNMTWAYPKDSSYLSSYNGDPLYMYDCIVDCINSQIMPRVENGSLHSVVPVGTAVMNARTSSLEDSMHRDNTHLTYEFGRYVSALTWFCHITGQSPYDTAFATQNTSLTTEQMNIVLESVYNAIENPYEISQSQYTE